MNFCHINIYNTIFRVFSDGSVMSALLGLTGVGSIFVENSFAFPIFFLHKTFAP